MAKKPKCLTCSSGWCRNHVFELTPLFKELFFRKNQRLRLCPHFNKNSNQFSKSIPIVNKDKKFYTPLFFQEDQKVFYEENDQRVHLNHMQKVQQNVSGTSEIVTILQVPYWELLQLNRYQFSWWQSTGETKNIVLCVGKYIKTIFNIFPLKQHINDQSHKRNVNCNKFTALIKQMESKFRKIRKVPLVFKFKDQAHATDQTNELSMVTEDLVQQFYQFKKKQEAFQNK